MKMKYLKVSTAILVILLIFDLVNDTMGLLCEDNSSPILLRKAKECSGSCKVIVVEDFGIEVHTCSKTTHKTGCTRSGKVLTCYCNTDLCTPVRNREDDPASWLLSEHESKNMILKYRPVNIKKLNHKYTNN